MKNVPSDFRETPPEEIISNLVALAVVFVCAVALVLLASFAVACWVPNLIEIFK